MEFEWDETKYWTNIAKHQVSFDLARSFDWDKASIEPDNRRDYGEDRFVARGRAEDGFAYHIAFTMRGNRVRIITVRRFNKKDYDRYGT